MNTKLLKAVALAALFAAPAAFATPITFDVTGTVNAIPNIAIAGTSVGSTITLAITIDTDNLYANAGSPAETYLQQIGGAANGLPATPQLINVVAAAGGNTYTDPLAGRAYYSNEVIISPSATPSYQLAEFSTDFSTVAFDFTLNLNGAGMYSATGTPPTSLGSSNSGSGVLQVGPYGAGQVDDFLVTSFSVPGSTGSSSGSAVPAPEVLSLMGLGVLGFAARRRKLTAATI